MRALVTLVTVPRTRLTNQVLEGFDKHCNLVVVHEIDSTSSSNESISTH
jgi:hypothetical protein